MFVCMLDIKVSSINLIYICSFAFTWLTRSCYVASEEIADHKLARIIG